MIESEEKEIWSQKNWVQAQDLLHLKYALEKVI